MKESVSIKRIMACLIAAVLLMTALSGCGSSKWLEENLTYAAEKVNDYAHFKIRNSGIFTEEIYAKAYAAVMMMNDESTDEDFEKIARYLSLDSITVADDSREVVAAYPAEEKGKSLKELGEKAVFMNIVRKNVSKQMTDPVKDEDSGEYRILAGVTRADGSGAVIIELTTADYADVCGETLAEKCGRNVMILEKDTVISSTIPGVNVSDTMDKLGTLDEVGKESFTITADDVKYQCQSTKADAYTVVCAEAA